jgi:hypothetical protein
MKFNPGDLVTLVNPIGDIMGECPPALVLQGSLGYPTGWSVSEIEPEEIYTILFQGDLEFRVPEDWMEKIIDYPEIS